MNISKCKLTGLKKSQEESWIIRTDKDPKSWASLYLLGDDIFVGEWHGYITKELNNKSDIAFNEILNRFNLREKGYHYILDNTDITGTSIEVRSTYTSFLNKEIPYMKSHILVGLKPVIRFITNIALRFHSVYSINKYVNNLPEAIDEIERNPNTKKHKLKETNHKSKNKVVDTVVEDEIETKPEFKSSYPENIDRSIDRSEENIWRYTSENGEYSIYGEILNDRIIYCKQFGERTLEQLNIFFSINKEMLNTLNNNDTILIEYIGNSSDVSESKRKIIVSFYRSLIGKIGHVIFIKPTIFQRATILMSKYLLRNKYKVHIVTNKIEAFDLAHEIRANENKDEIVHEDIIHTKSNEEEGKRINQLLNIVGRISWDPTFEDNYSKDVVGNDEFSILFESFEMLRNDIISMKRELESNSKKLQLEVDKATERLQKQNIELEKAKEQAEKSNKLKSEFLANISHEIRTPMNAIVGLTEVLKDDNISEENRKLYLNLISKSNTHLLSLINDVVDVSKIEADEMKLSFHKFNLNELLRDLLNSQEAMIKNSGKSKQIKYKLVLGLSDELSHIKTDSTRLKQVLLNLLNNAYKFTNSGEIEFGYTLKGDNLHFYVKDTGIGIEKSKQKHIFDRFTQAEGNTTRKYGGSGLGLSISKSLVELCGGTISVESEPGKGSTFTFTLLYQCKTDELTSNIDEDKDINLENLNILVAEDDLMNYTVIKAILAPLKCNLTRVENGIEAVNEISNNQDYDIILMDIQMPEMDGIEATKQIQKITTKIPIIAQTANAFEGEMKQVLDAGCVDYITKPINKKLLLKSIRKNINYK